MEYKNQLTEIVSHYDGSQTKAIELLDVLRSVSEKTRVNILQMLLSFSQLCCIKDEDINRCFLPSTTYVMSVRILKNLGDTRGVAGKYKLYACKRCSDGTEAAPVEIPFSTRAGKVLYLLVLASSCPELGGSGAGFNRSDIRPMKEMQCEAIREIFHVLFGKTKKVSNFIEGIAKNYYNDHNNDQFFSRTKHDTNCLIQRSMDITDYPQSFIICGDKNEPRRIPASLDIEHSDPDIIACLHSYIQATAIATALPVPFKRKD